MTITNKDLSNQINNIDNHLAGIDTQLNGVQTHLGSIDITLGRQAVSLDEHIRRTGLLEQSIIAPIRLVTQVDTVLKVLGFILVSLTAVTGITSVLHYLLHVSGVF
jgi:hypothetical protein